MRSFIRYTRAEPHDLILDHPYIVETAEKLTAETGDVFEYARAALYHVNDNFVYTSTALSRESGLRATPPCTHGEERSACRRSGPSFP